MMSGHLRGDRKRKERNPTFSLFPGEVAGIKDVTQFS
jgi:hypothetical protein